MFRGTAVAWVIFGFMLCLLCVNPVEIGVCFLEHSDFSQCFKHKPNSEKNKHRCPHTQPRREFLLRYFFNISVESRFSKRAKPRRGGICIKVGLTHDALL